MINLELELVLGLVQLEFLHAVLTQVTLSVRSKDPCRTGNGYL